VRETEAMIGKAPRLGIDTPKYQTALRPYGSFSERNIWGTQFEQKFLSCYMDVRGCEMEGARGGCGDE